MERDLKKKGEDREENRNHEKEKRGIRLFALTRKQRLENEGTNLTFEVKTRRAESTGELGVVRRGKGGGFQKMVSDENC